MPKRFLPLIIFSALIILLSIGLTLNPKDVPSPLVNKPANHFELPRLYADESFNSEHLQGEIWLLNVFASWCLACEAEHEKIMQFAKDANVKWIGLNYKDTEQEAKNWLDKRGNPYHAVVQDASGLTGINWGVYGVPETFVIDKQGIVRHKFTGPLNAKSIKETLIPLLNKLAKESS